MSLHTSQNAAAAAAKSLQSCLTLCDPIDGSPLGSTIPGILQARTRVGCHCLLQCMKVKSESEVTQSCPTLHDPMDCSLPGSSIPGIFPGKSSEVGCHCQSEWPSLKSLKITKMMERVWRKGNPLTLLVGMQTSTAVMKNSVEIP